MEEQLIEMGNRIRIRRKALKIKQSDLAEALGISNNHMSSIENGRQKPSLEIFINLCEQLDTTPNHLLLGCMYPENISKDIIDTISLCNKEQTLLIRDFVELIYTRNLSKI